MNWEPKYMLNYHRCDNEKVSYLLFRYYTSNTSLDWLLAFYTIFGICINMALFNRQSRKTPVR